MISLCKKCWCMTKNKKVKGTKNDWVCGKCGAKKDRIK